MLRTFVGLFFAGVILNFIKGPSSVGSALGTGLGFIAISVLIPQLISWVIYPFNKKGISNERYQVLSMAFGILFFILSLLFVFNNSSY